jgi:hypothetical protein
MIEIILHRAVYWHEGGEQREVHGIKTLRVPECFSAGMGIIADSGVDPEDAKSMFVNESGCLVVELGWWQATSSCEENTPEGLCDIFLGYDNGWRPAARWDHYTATPEDAAGSERCCPEQSLP